MTVVCTKCNWTHFAVTQEYAENEVNEFNAWFDKQPKAMQESYGNKHSRIESYHCHCGNRSYRPGNSSLNGSTLGPVIYEPANPGKADGSVE